MQPMLRSHARSVLLIVFLVDSLTNVDDPAGTDLQFEYDALQRRTRMVDAFGTTIYTYTVGTGMCLIAEDGPWASGTLRVTHRLGRRLGLQPPFNPPPAPPGCP